LYSCFSIDTAAYRQTDIETQRDSDRQTDIETQRDSDRQTDTKINRQTDIVC